MCHTPSLNKQRQQSAYKSYIHPCVTCKWTLNSSLTRSWDVRSKWKGHSTGDLSCLTNKRWIYRVKESLLTYIVTFFCKVETTKCEVPANNSLCASFLDPCEGDMEGGSSILGFTVITLGFKDFRLFFFINMANKAFPSFDTACLEPLEWSCFGEWGHIVLVLNMMVAHTTSVSYYINHIICECQGN